MSEPTTRPPLDIAKVREELRAAAELEESAVGSVGALVNQRARQAWVDLGQRVPDLLDELETARDRLALATEFAVNVVPDHVEFNSAWELTVRLRDGGRWAVDRRGRRCLGADGRWSPELRESDDDWTQAHRFDLDTALRLAREHAPDVTVNGMRAADWPSWAEPAPQTKGEGS